jgi:hypothetical protein
MKSADHQLFRSGTLDALALTSRQQGLAWHLSFKLAWHTPSALSPSPSHQTLVGQVNTRPTRRNLFG